MSFIDKIFVIEIAWFDPMENRNAHGYRLHSFVATESEAIDICTNGKKFTPENCWSIEYITNKILPEFRYRTIHYYKNI